MLVSRRSVTRPANLRTPAARVLATFDKLPLLVLTLESERAPPLEALVLLVVVVVLMLVMLSLVWFMLDRCG